MGRYVAERLLQTIVVLLGISTIVFFVLRLTGDPVLLMVRPEATAEQVAQLRHAFGFDRPLIIQYLDFLVHALRGDFGISLRHQDSALGLVLERVSATAELAATSMGLALLIAVPAGVLAATRRRTWIGPMATSLALLGQSH